jgi:hypothetical protein
MALVCSAKSAIDVHMWLLYAPMLAQSPLILPSIFCSLKSKLSRNPSSSHVQIEGRKSRRELCVTIEIYAIKDIAGVQSSGDADSKFVHLRLRSGEMVLVSYFSQDATAADVRCWAMEAAAGL